MPETRPFFLSVPCQSKPYKLFKKKVCNFLLEKSERSWKKSWEVNIKKKKLAFGNTPRRKSKSEIDKQNYNNAFGLNRKRFSAYHHLCTTKHWVGFGQWGVERLTQIDFIVTHPKFNQTKRKKHDQAFSPCPAVFSKPKSSNSKKNIDASGAKEQQITWGSVMCERNFSRLFLLCKFYYRYALKVPSTD